MKLSTENPAWTEAFDKRFSDPADLFSLEPIKEFISSLLQSEREDALNEALDAYIGTILDHNDAGASAERQRTLQLIEGMRIEEHVSGAAAAIAYNQALDALREKLTKNE